MISPYEQWNKKLLSLTPEQFEELCLLYIKSTGLWANPRWRKGGSDKGRDIEAEKVTKPDGVNTVIEKWFFQCKRYESGIGQQDIASAVEWADAERADYLVIASNSNLTNQCQDFLNIKKSQIHCKIVPWTDATFVDLLLSIPHVLAPWWPADVTLQSPKKPGRLFELVLDMKPEQCEKLRQKLTAIATTDKKIHVKALLETIDQEVLGAGVILDDNVKSLAYQQFSAILALKNEDAAIKYLEKALEITPKNKLTLQQMAHLLFKKKRFEEALKYCDKILELDDKDTLAWNNKGVCLNAIRKTKISAKRSYEKALEIDPTFSIARRNLATLLTNQGDFVDAAIILTEGIKHSKDPLIYDALGLLFKELNSFTHAVEQHDKSISIAPLFEDAWNNKGVALEHLARTKQPIDAELVKQALICFQKVVEINPNKALGWSNLSVCHTQSGDFEGAIKAYEKAIELDKDDGTAQNQKATILHQQGKNDEAIKILDEAVKKSTNNEITKNLYRTKARILQATNKIPDALAAIDKAIEHGKHSPELLESKAQILFQDGKTADAERMRIIARSAKIKLDRDIETILKLTSTIQKESI